ncbi:MAG: TonB-dependent receptor [Gammaproteobacteria bacterium CG22_combo_CG10-13_8_21_14_all_40_8]|nr:MAG: TonB-dependent receptor [Gammaproteobacteria bacterium CG22_combo_CG10-13_8_21_14_all_40_8]
MRTLNIHKHLYFTATLLASQLHLALADTASADASDNLIIITSDYRHETQDEQSSSITVLDQQLIEEGGEQHFEELINWVPNLNWAGGSSRPQYFQIRGIGERSQYLGAPNPSVGFIIDDIDMSGIGGVATLFDVQQIEVLKGPQGARYGANALGGLIYIKTLDPSNEFEGHAKITLAEDNTRSLGLSVSGPASESLGYRLSLQQHNSDGYRKNQFLDRSDTNERDELTARLKLRWEISHQLTADITLINIDLNNGYDAWVQDNSLNTQTDDPGRDEQLTHAAAVKLNWSAAQAFDLISISSIATSDILNSFDGDWGNPVFWGENGPYDFTSRTDRYRRTVSQELRLVSKPDQKIFSNSSDWLLGVYATNLREKNTNLDMFNGDVFNQLNSDYDATNSAIFGEIDYHVDAENTLKTGLRLEHRNADYQDSQGQNLSPSETMIGGHITLQHQHHNNMLGYATLSKGFKAGGFNIDTNIPADRIEFDAESLWNFELGVKALAFDNRLKIASSLFYMKRSKQQVETSFQDDPTDPLSFTFLTANAAKGTNYGLETELEFKFTDNWKLFANTGLLFTQFDSFVSAERNLKGRDQAHAPNYSYALGSSYRGDNGLFLRAELTGKDRFYYSNSHDQRSKSYNLLNVKMGYEFAQWSIYLWGRNILDKEYHVRGFFFANEPPDWIETLYTRQGDPAQWGLTANMNF